MSYAPAKTFVLDVDGELETNFGVKFASVAKLSAPYEVDVKSSAASRGGDIKNGGLRGRTEESICGTDVLRSIDLRTNSVPFSRKSFCLRSLDSLSCVEVDTADRGIGDGDCGLCEGDRTINDVDEEGLAGEGDESSGTAFFFRWGVQN